MSYLKKQILQDYHKPDGFKILKISQNILKIILFETSLELISFFHALHRKKTGENEVIKMNCPRASFLKTIAKLYYEK